MKVGRRFIRCGEAGQPDIMALHLGKFIGIECKAPGKYQTPEQKEWERVITQAGGIYVLARAVTDVRLLFEVRKIPFGEQYPIADARQTRPANAPLMPRKIPTLAGLPPGIIIHNQIGDFDR